MRAQRSPLPVGLLPGGLLCAGLLWGLAVGGGTATARPPAPAADVQSLMHRLDAQDTRIRELEAQLQTQGEFLQRLPTVPAGHGSVTPRLASLETAAAEPEAEDPGWIDVSTEKWKMKFGGEIQGDYVMYAHQDSASRAAYGNIPNYYEFRRLRFWVSGTGYGVYDFKFQVDFEPENSLSVRNSADTGPATIAATGVGMRDMYVGIHEIPILGYVRFGQYYEPFGLEQNTSDKYVTFMERSLPVIFARSRQVGVTAYNHTESESLFWAYGAFFHAIDATVKERISDDQGIDLAFRGVWTPWYESDGRYLLHLGGGYVYTDLTDQTARFRARPDVHESTVLLDTGRFNAESIHRGNVEAALVMGPLSLQGEFYALRTNGFGGTPDMDLHGAYAFVSYFLTGEHRPYSRTTAVFKRVTPYTNFFIVDTPYGRQAGWGAWEALARWSYLDLDSAGLTSATRGQLHDLTLGLTWYWTPYTKMTFNWIHAFGNVAGGGPNETDVIGTRIQLAF